jgi:hypothetical protein
VVRSGSAHQSLSSDWWIPDRPDVVATLNAITGPEGVDPARERLGLSQAVDITQLYWKRAGMTGAEYDR